MAQWGYSSPERDVLSFNADTVAEWHTPAAGQSPQQRLVDFSVLPSPAHAVKNDSTVGGNGGGGGGGGCCEPEVMGV